MKIKTSPDLYFLDGSMVARKIYTQLTLVAIIASAATLAYVTVSPSGFSGAPIAAAIIAVMLYLVLAVGRDRGKIIRSSIDHPEQHVRVWVLITCCLVIQLGLGMILQRLAQLDLITTTTLSLFAWGLIPALGLHFGIVRWPRKVGSLRNLEKLAISVFAIAVALIFFALTMVPYVNAVPMRLPGGLPTDVVAVILGATVEEIVFRVLLLTALLAVTGSRFQALVLSATVFAAYHVPAAVAAPIAMLDWGVAADYLRDLAPQMVWKIGFGLFLGALWVRTGSLTLIAAFHAIANLGPVWKAGFGVLTGDVSN